MTMPDDAFWIDGEWISWDDVEDEYRHETELVRLAKDAVLKWNYPNADPELVPYYEELLDLARDYHWTTGRHLDVYGQIGELHGAVKHGIKLHQNPHVKGSDGRLGDDFVEIKTISPVNKTLSKPVQMTQRNFSKVLLVRIDVSFAVKSYLISRLELQKGRKSVQVCWEGIRAVD